jgi:hypothetical protein
LLKRSTDALLELVLEAINWNDGDVDGDVWLVGLFH